MKISSFRLITALFLISSFTLHAKEYHVSINKGNDQGPGTEAAPFRTINAAASVAYPGDVITIHSGVYREWINPPRGGVSDDLRIVYRSAPGEKVEVKGSEVIKNWEKTADGIWKVSIPNSFFGSHNPFRELVQGDWFDGDGRIHHTGEVFLNGKSLYERASLQEVIHSVKSEKALDAQGSLYVWYCESDENTTTIWANFQQNNPNRELIEISVRNTCFYPEKKGVDYITISGIEFSQAASQWAAPTAEQIGMIATHWNKGWIIENNIIHDAKCSGITLGKERSTGHNVWLNDMSKDGSIHYIEVIFRTLKCGWNKENIGSHIVRNNTIYNCEQTGICGSMGAAFSVIENNHIYNIWTKRQFHGAEIAGIKFHAAVDTKISNNRINHTGRGIWLDWLTQGTIVSNNLLQNNDIEDIYVEVNHGPFLIYNNILASPVSLHNQSQGGAFVHNLFAGTIFDRTEHHRYTPYLFPHQTDVAGLSIILGGDDRFYNNLFVPKKQDSGRRVQGAYGLAAYDKAALPMTVDGNVYTNGAKPYGKEIHNMNNESFNPELTIEDNGKEVFVRIQIPSGISELKTQTINSGWLGKAKYPNAPYVNPDGSDISINTDYQGNKRMADNPKPGPFEQIKEGENVIKVW